jgi:hypothetical protein
MRTVPIHLAVEDELSEFVLRRILASRPVEYAVGAVFSHGGCGYLKKRAKGFNEAARGCPWLVLTDLDVNACPPDLVRNWLGRRPRHPDFLLRVAVPEVESWVMADREGLRAHLGIGGRLVPREPEKLLDAKSELLSLAERSPDRAVREAIVFRGGDGQLRQGADYNGELGRFVYRSWNLEAAKARARSLRRLLVALAELEKRHGAAGPRGS